MSVSKYGPIEYAVYTYDSKKPDQKADLFWRRHLIVHSPDQAVQEAKALLDAKKYEKIEIKKKFFDPRQNRMVNVTMKVLETPPLRPWPWMGVLSLRIWGYAGIGFIALIAAFAAFA